MGKKRRLFSELGPAAYAISLRKEILKRHAKDLLGRERFARNRSQDWLPAVVASWSGNLIKRGPGIDPALQQNKVSNIRIACAHIDGIIVQPGETFSFWKLVGKTTARNGFAEGRVIAGGRLVSGIGGGLCNLANTLCLLLLNSPVTITELHHHSDALAPDPNNVRVPYSAGTSVNYNAIDLRFRNDTDQPIQFHTWCEGDILHAEMRTTEEFPWTYRIVEEGHHFRKEGTKHYRVSKIYRETYDRVSGELLGRELHWNNHSEVMFDPRLIPAELIVPEG